VNNSSTFIKDIEQFFLNLSQKGIMLSSRDYHLVMKWMEKGITKEQILSGIRNAFQIKDIKRIRSLDDCREFVELEDGTHETTNDKKIKTSPEYNNYFVQVIANFKKLTDRENNQKLLNFFNVFNDKVKYLINSNDNEIFQQINSLEDKFFDKFPKYLNKNESQNYQSELKNFISSGNDYINEKAKNKALNNFSKNFIIDNYIGFNPFEL